MTRYRVVIEIDVDHSTARAKVNEMALDASSNFTTRFSNCVYVATEKVEANKDVLKRNVSNVDG